VIREYQQTPYSDDALVLIRNAYKELGVTDLEGDIQKILDVNQHRTRANVR
jgi:outer membrane protein assembly factor BamD (BamD/ComL family)